MLSKVEQAEQKWGGMHELVDSWLNERKKLLVQYCELAGLPPYEHSDKALPTKERVEAFCELLMDYISAGHFELFDKIMDECSQVSDNKKLAEEIYPKITETTDSALTFNDYYASISDEDELAGFDQNLAVLGEKMEERFELEDKLLATIERSTA
ncbi:MAG: sigma D regulator [Aestuariibacter sp.]